MPTNTDAGAFLTFIEDGSVNLITGIVENGCSTQTAMAQIVASRLGMDPVAVHVIHDEMNDFSHHNRTLVARRSLLMAGNNARVRALSLPWSTSCSRL
jgi:CO/xanthine dehydrogenase Mo-binding subunit